MYKRESISKKVRFEVFKRDLFTCQYCGITPPNVILEIDHIKPVSRGGDNKRDNLITACFDCNRGKSNVLLSSLPDSVAQKAELIAEKLSQLKAYERLIKARKKHEEKQINEVEEAFQMYFEATFKLRLRESIRTFLQLLPSHEIIEAMHIACRKSFDSERTIKYFCGICWKSIRNINDGE
jgi:hypothetical protein